MFLRFRFLPSSPTHLNLRVAELAKSFGVSRCWPKALAASATVHPKTKLRRNTSVEYAAPAIVACLSWLAIVASIDGTGDYPRACEGPGLTVDETINVEQGVFLTVAIRQYGLGLLDPESIREVFGGRSHFPDHPPLGRLWIGICHELTSWLCPPLTQNRRVSVVCARTASATAFAVLVFLVGIMAGKWYGPGTGAASALAVALTPRLFGHAHLAALETVTGLAYAASVLCVAHTWTTRTRPSWKAVCWCGVLFGLALLTKIQAVLLTVPVALWAIWQWKRHGILPIVLWGLIGLLVFFIGWPWLWLDPWGHLVEYFGRTTERMTLSVWYCGQKFADRSVPWHYPWVMFLTTVPLGLHALAIVGITGRRPHAWREPRERLLLGCTLFPLCLFSLPGISVYDGGRLFLVIYPLWAVFAGRGCLSVWEYVRDRTTPRLATALIGLFLVLQGYGLVVLHPCELSHYNLLAGGLRGADRLGFEVTYWGDSVTRSFLNDVTEKVPDGAVIAVFPALHPIQWEDVRQQSPILRAHGITLPVYSTPAAKNARYLLIFRRNADLAPELRQPLSKARLLTEVRRCGVQLTALYEFDN